MGCIGYRDLMCELLRELVVAGSLVGERGTKFISKRVEIHRTRWSP